MTLPESAIHHALPGQELRMAADEVEQEVPRVHANHQRTAHRRWVLDDFDAVYTIRHHHVRAPGERLLIDDETYYLLRSHWTELPVDHLDNRAVEVLQQLRPLDYGQSFEPATLCTRVHSLVLHRNHLL